MSKMTLMWILTIVYNHILKEKSGAEVFRCDNGRIDSDVCAEFGSGDGEVVEL